MMNTLDVILLIILLIGAFRGFQKGLFIEVIGIAALVIAVIGGFKLLHTGIAFLNTHFGNFSHLVPYIAFILIFLIILVLINLLGRTIKKALDLTLLGSLDNFAGALLGVLKWGIAVSILLWLTHLVGFRIPEETQQASFIYPYIEPLGPKTIAVISSFIPFTGDLIAAIKDLIEPPSA